MSTIKVEGTNVTPTQMDMNFSQRILHITSDTPLNYALPVQGYLMPFLLVITIIANTLVVIVLSKKHMRSPTNLVLMAMAISDTLTIIFPAPWYFYIYTLGNYKNILCPVEACYAFIYMVELMPNFFHTASIWLTLALALQRYIYVCHAPVARTWCTNERVIRGIWLIFILSFVHISTRLFDQVFTSTMYFDKTKNETVPACKIAIASWVTNYITQNVYFGTYYIFRVLFVHVGPCLCLVILNMLLFKVMRQAKKNRARLFKDKSSRNDCKNSGRDSNCTTLMLIVVVSVFLAVEIPLAVTTTIHVAVNFLTNAPEGLYAQLNSIILFTNFLMMMSFPVNFAIYCGMSRQFRETFKELFVFGQAVSRTDGSTRYSVVNGPRTVTHSNETVL